MLEPVDGLGAHQALWLKKQELTMTSIALSLRIKKLFENLDGLEQVETLARSKFAAEATKLSEISHYLFDTGGKRIRPALALLVGRAFGISTPTQPLIDVSAGIELIHMATLLHDDIIDKSPTRRHQQSPYIRYGTPPTLLAGDFLLTRAFSLCAKLDTTIIDETEKACVALVEGEILESSLWEEAHSVDSSITIARKKTAALFRLAAFCGTYIGNNPPPTVEAAAMFGEQLGIAFQILDDILDVTSNEDILGKRTGTDMLERKPSMLNVLWLASGDEAAQFLRRQPDDRHDSELVAEAVRYLRANGTVIGQARALAREYIEGAERYLAVAAAEAPQVNEDAMAGLRLLSAFTLERLG